MFHLALDNRGQMEDGGGLGGPGIRCQHGLLILDIYKHHNIAIHGITVLTPATLHTGDTQIHTAGARTSGEEMSRRSAKISQSITPTRTFSWLKAPTSAFTFKNLWRHYETNCENFVDLCFQL